MDTTQGSTFVIEGREFFIKKMSAIEQFDLFTVSSEVGKAVIEAYSKGSEISPIEPILQLTKLDMDTKHKIFTMCLSKCFWVNEGNLIPISTGDKITLDWIEREGYFLTLIMEVLRINQENFSRGAGTFLSITMQKYQTEK